MKIELQVDDKHELYVDGSLKSFGEHWSQLYTVTVTSADVLALYAENFVSTEANLNSSCQCLAFIALNSLKTLIRLRIPNSPSATHPPTHPPHKKKKKKKKAR